MMMKFLIFIAFAICSHTASVFPSQTIQSNGLVFTTDLETPQLAPGESAVFPYSDEAAILLEIASQIKAGRGRQFDIAIDSFCGDGKSGLPLVSHGIADRLLGSDLNSRAIMYAQENAAFNHLETKCSFSVRDILRENLTLSPSPGNTLWIANPPFALKAKGTALEIMRDGGENGLTLTLAFASQALDCATPGDVILGISYSRIRTDGKIELEEELKKIMKKEKLTLVLLDDQKLWRGFNGKKEQTNPMPITEATFALKANPFHADEVRAYQEAALFHLQVGYDKLGYYSFIIHK